MHCLQTAELAARLSQHGQAILYRAPAICTASMTAYWSASQQRMSRWHEALGGHRTAAQYDGSLPIRGWWRGQRTTLEEILLGEILTRTVAVIGAGIDASRGIAESAPITDSIHLSHLETRNRVMNLILQGRGASVTDKVRLNRLRQATERWTDALVGRMCVDHPSLVRYAVDAERASSYAEDTRQLTSGAYRQTADELMNAAMSDTLRRRCGASPANGKLNRSVADTVLGMLRPVLFDDHGMTKSIFMHRREIDWTLGDTRAEPQPLTRAADTDDRREDFQRQE